MQLREVTIVLECTEVDAAGTVRVLGIGRALVQRIFDVISTIY